MNSTVLEKLSRIAEARILEEGESYELTEASWCLLSGGAAKLNGAAMSVEEDYGCRPFVPLNLGTITSKSGCSLLLFDAKNLEKLRLETPQLNYYLRKMRMQDAIKPTAWQLGRVEIFD